MAKLRITQVYLYTKVERKMIEILLIFIKLKILLYYYYQNKILIYLLSLYFLKKINSIILYYWTCFEYVIYLFMKKIFWQNKFFNYFSTFEFCIRTMNCNIITQNYNYTFFKKNYIVNENCLFCLNFLKTEQYYILSKWCKNIIFISLGDLTRIIFSTVLSSRRLEGWLGTSG